MKYNFGHVPWQYQFRTFIVLLYIVFSELPYTNAYRIYQSIKILS